MTGHVFLLSSLLVQGNYLKKRVKERSKPHATKYEREQIQQPKEGHIKRDTRETEKDTENEADRK